MMRKLCTTLFLILTITATACGTPSVSALQAAASPTSYWSFLWPLQTAWQTATAMASETPAPPPLTSTSTYAATDTPEPTSTETPLPTLTETPLATSRPGTTNLSATVTAGLLSCRYGPGPEYLYLYALRQGANIKLIGRAEGDNWHWAWVEGRNRCWVNTRYLQVEGDRRQLPIVYPGPASLPVSPYYPPSSIVSVVRLGNSVTVEWVHIPLRAGDEEDDSMQHYILEVWHCKGGTLLFEPLATNDTMLTVIDEPGCSSASHARLFVQEKHGFSGPTNVPWPTWR